MSSTKVDRRLYHYRAQVVRVIDGDSCIMNIDTEFGIWLCGGGQGMAGRRFGIVRERHHRPHREESR